MVTISLVVISLDRTSRSCRGRKSDEDGGVGLQLRFFADDVILPASPDHDFQCELGQFEPKPEVWEGCLGQ